MKEDHVDQIMEQWADTFPALDVSAMGIVSRISRISQHIDKKLQLIFSGYDLVAGEFDVLATLRRSGHPHQLTPTELFSALMLSSGAMTNRLDRLEAAGLIERQPNPEDRRGLLVKLTERGTELMDKAYPAHMANEEDILSRLSKDEREAMTDLLRKLLLSFEESKKK
jgi:DNA-binding MarR family transcriptional regulator